MILLTHNRVSQGPSNPVVSTGKRGIGGFYKFLWIRFYLKSLPLPCFVIFQQTSIPIFSLSPPPPEVPVFEEKTPPVPKFIIIFSNKKFFL